jgi:alkylation response protein AidB-like acyl-CoA dehydrogenase
VDFSLSPDQILIRDSVARFGSTYGAGSALDPWPTFAEVGWLGLGAPAELDGFGGPIEISILMEQFGRHLVAEPYIAQVVLAGTILREAGRHHELEGLLSGAERFAVAYEEPRGRYDPAYVETRASKSAGGFVLSGEKVRAAGTKGATQVILSARDGDEPALYVVPLDNAGITRRDVLGADGHAVASLSFDEVQVERSSRIGSDGTGLQPLELGLESANAAVCAEALGVMSAMLDMTVTYTKQRTQFNVAISSFQALQHRMAEMFIELELVRSMVFLAAMALDSDSGSSVPRSVSAAKSYVAQAARFIGQNAIQLHGAIGITEEYQLGQYFKRLTILERIFGDKAYHLRRFSQLSKQGVN